jgi:hypothetical protein
VRSVVRGHRRAAGTAPAEKAPATAERIIAMALVPGDGLKAILLATSASARSAATLEQSKRHLIPRISDPRSNEPMLTDARDSIFGIGSESRINESGY